MSTRSSRTRTGTARISQSAGACTGSATPGPAGATPARTRTPRVPTPRPRWCVSSCSTRRRRRDGPIPPGGVLDRSTPPGRKLAVGLRGRGLQATLLFFALRVVLVGQGGTAGQGPDRAGEVLYLGGDHEELARRSLGHLGEGLQVEVAQGFGGEVGVLQALEELAGHLDLGGLHVAVGLRLALGAQDCRALFAFCAEDRGFLLAFGLQDRGALVAFRGQDRGATGPLRLHLLLHRLL